MFLQIFMSKTEVSTDCLWTQLRFTATLFSQKQKAFHKCVLNVTNSYMWVSLSMLKSLRTSSSKVGIFHHWGKTAFSYFFMI